MDGFLQINGKIYKITENYKIRKIRELPASLTWRSLTGSAVLWTADFLVVPMEYGKTCGDYRELVAYYHLDGSGIAKSVEVFL